MKKIALVLLCSLLFVATISAGNRKKDYIISFYNLENLFDTYHDEGKIDGDYLPDGKNLWTENRYKQKLANMASVIRAIADDNRKFPTVMGLAEIENRHVLEDLVCEKDILSANYQIVHYDSPDKRGIDVALLYRPDQFEVLDTKILPFNFDSPTIDFSAWSQEEKEAFKTRDILEVRGRLNGEMFAFFVGHFPSRLGGKGADLRPRAAEIMYKEALRLMSEYKGIKIILMGDMNDNPDDESMVKYLHGKETIAEQSNIDFFDPFLSMYKAGYGSLEYRGTWNIFDIIMVNKALSSTQKGLLEIVPIVKNKYYGRVFKPSFIVNEQGVPFRTFSRGNYIGGYSDHFPTYIKLKIKS